MARSPYTTAAASALILSMLACNMPLPTSLAENAPDFFSGATSGPMSLEEAIDIAPDDSRADVIAMMGAPDAFSLHWQPVAGRSVRWEEWSYFDAETRFDFIDGELLWTAEIDPAPDGSLFAHQYDPTDFLEGDSLEDLSNVLDILGPQELETVLLDEADAPGGEIAVGDQILLGFDQGSLVSVDTFILAPDSSLSSTGAHRLAAALPQEGRPAAERSADKPSAAQEGLSGGDLSNVVPVVGFLVGWSHRNRVYREAERFIADRNAYYDKLRDTARSQLTSRQIGGLRSSQVAAYTKVVAMIEDQRQAELAVAEASKNEARKAFNKRVEGIIVQRLLGTGAIQRVFSAMNKGLNSSQGFLDQAIQDLSGGAGGALGELQKVQRIARDVQRVAGAIGGRTGAGLQRIAGGVADAIDRPQAMIREDIEKVQSDLGELQDGVGTLAAVGRTPSAGGLAAGLVLRPVAGEDPAVQAVTVLISRLSVGDGSLAEQAQAALDAGFVGRCAAIAQAYREAFNRLQAGSGDALSGESAAAPCRAIDPEELAKRAASATPTGEAANVPPPPDVSQVEASIEVVSVKYTKTNCFTSSVNGWFYCDLGVDVKVAYETSVFPAVIHCFIGNDDQYEEVHQRSGDVKMHGDDDARNMDIALNLFAFCEVLVSGERVAATSVPGEE